MSKWAYKIVTSEDIQAGTFKKDRSKIENYLNELGAEGWEIVNLDFRELDARLTFTGVAKRKID